jgi:hypothetical protein
MRTAAGDVGMLVTARPLDPPQTMPDTLLAWRANPSAHLHDTLALVQALAVDLRNEASAPPTAWARDLDSAVELPGIPMLDGSFAAAPQSLPLLRNVTGGLHHGPRHRRRAG